VRISDAARRPPTTPPARDREAELVSV
jgi:hypothetical protein